MEYAVRGELVIKAGEYQKQLADGSADLPFDEIILCNIGNPQSVGQKPFTFFRQVLAACMYPELIDSGTLPKDAAERAATILAGMQGGVGAYSGSKGVDSIRENVAAYIQERDGGELGDPENIFLTSGASEGIKTIMQLATRNESDGILIPTPQYPLYSATVTAIGAAGIGYSLEESTGWKLQPAEITALCAEARNNGITPRCLVIINPGNPTGQLLNHDDIAEIIAVAEEEGLMLLADEVYQENVYHPGQEFTSFKKVVEATGSAVECASFHSVSKGFQGECGMRGGYMELYNFDHDAVEAVYKCVSVGLCSNLPGQVCVDLMVKPPKEGDESYPLYAEERDGIFSSLGRRAKKLVDSLNALDGMTCNPSDGAMYSFPRVHLPPKAIAAAEAQGVEPDFLYCSELLDATGICTVPGSGFGQEEGTYHFRTTFLPQEETMDKMISLIGKFQAEFMAKYA